MTNQFFEDVVITGEQDTTQLQVQGAANQTAPLQTWENSAGDILAQVTSDGRLELGTLAVEPPGTVNALIEANNDIDLDTSAPQQGIQSRGIIRRVTSAIGDAIAWIVHELEFQGSGGVDDEHTTFHSRIINSSTGDAGGATLRAGDFEAVIKEVTGGATTGTAVGLRSAVTNEVNAVLNTAVGAEITVTNAGQLQSAYGVVVNDMPPSANEAYSIVTGNAPVKFGAEQELKVLGTTPTDAPSTGFIKLYPKVEAGNPKLYAKWQNQEYEVTGGAHTHPASEITDLDTEAGIAQWNANKLQGRLVANVQGEIMDGKVLLWQAGNERWFPGTAANIANFHTEVSNILSVAANTAQWNANKLQNRTVSTTPPTPGQALVWSSGNWRPGTIDSSNGGVPTGAIMMWPTDTAPSGWLLCHGQWRSRETYSELDTVLQGAFGQTDTTFKLPDMRGRFPLGQDDMGGTPAGNVSSGQSRVIGGSSGSEDHTLTTLQLPSHSHAENYESGPAYDWNIGTPRTSITGTSGYNGDGTRLVTDSVGNGNVINHMPPYLTLNYIIKT